MTVKNNKKEAASAAFFVSVYPEIVIDSLKRKVLV